MLFSSRELEIMNYLFANDQLSVSELADSVDISLRTLHLDIETINKQLDQQAKGVSIQREKQWYSWTFENIQNFQKFEIEFRKKVERRLPWTLDNDRISHILRTLLIAHDYIKSSFFQDYFNISDTTLTKDLNVVRHILNYYNLTLQYKPYYGLKVTGSEFSKLCSYVDFSDIYTFESDPWFVVHSCDDLLITTSEFQQVYEQVKQYCHNELININDLALLDSCIFVCAIYRKGDMSKDIEKWLQEYLMKPDTYFKDYVYFSMDISLIEPAQKNDFLEELSKEIKVNLSDDKCINNYVDNLSIRIKGMVEIGYFKYKYSQTEVKLLEYLNVSNSIAFLIYCSLLEKEIFIIDLYSKLALFLYNQFFTIPNTYQKLKILIVNPVAKLMNQTFIYRSDLDLSEIVFIDVYDHELYSYDLSKIDAIIFLENSQKNFREFNVPVFYFDLFVQQKEYRKLWDKLILKHQKNNFAQTSFKKNESKEIAISKQKTPMQYNIYTKYIDEWLFLQNQLIKNKPGHLIIFSDTNTKQTLYIDEKKNYIVEINMKNDLLSVKQAETLLRPYLEK